MTSQAFHLIMLLLLAAMTLLSWCGYKAEPWERRTALRCNAMAGGWFFYLFWMGPPEFLEFSYARSGLVILSLALAINARRLFLGLEFLTVKHWADAPVSSALRSGRRVDFVTTVRLGDPPASFLIPGLRIFFHRRQAEQALALREKVRADALLAEAIVRRERAREQAEALEARRRAPPDAWREAVSPRFGRSR